MEFKLSPHLARLARCGNVQDFADAGPELFGNPVLIMDINLRLIACTDVEVDDDHYNELRRNRSLSSKMPGDTHWVDKIRRDIRTEEPRVTDNNGLSIMTKTLRDNGVMVGQLLIPAYFRPHTQADFDMAELVSYPLAMAVFRHVAGRFPISSEAEFFLEYLLDGNVITEPELELKLKVMDWQPSRRLRILCARVDDEAADLRSRLSGLEMKLLRYHGYYVALASDSDPQELKAVFSGSAVGMSREFDSLYKIKPAFDQAAAALEIGQRIWGGPGFFVYERLADYMPIYKYEPKSELPDFVIPQLLDMAGEENGQELMRTLRAYLYSNRSVQSTASSLHVHRNTVAYRVTKAMQRLGLDMDDGQGFRRLYTSLQILEYLDREKYFGPDNI